MSRQERLALFYAVMFKAHPSRGRYGWFITPNLNVEEAKQEARVMLSKDGDVLPETAKFTRIVHHGLWCDWDEKEKQ